jgi:acyl-CoA reductase-like NAD-dependent aldehyde dehydrogenase
VKLWFEADLNTKLGGKAPMVILKDANLEEACKAAAFGAMQHQGQICMYVRHGSFVQDL